jgi:hypothetical protein
MSKPDFSQTAQHHYLYKCLRKPHPNLLARPVLLDLSEAGERVREYARANPVVDDRRVGAANDDGARCGAICLSVGGG